MKLETIFSNFVVTDHLNIDNEKLKLFCYKMYSPQRNFVDVRDPELKEFINIVEDQFSKLHIALQFSDDTYQEIDKCWINIKPAKSITSPHIHPRRFLTAVYYVSASENCGNLFLMNPNPHHDHIIPASASRNVVKSYIPVEFESSCPSKISLFNTFLKTC
jgi:uncharacterized protein (TIGR02466 family)